MKNSIDDNTLARYLSKECNAEEIEKVEMWIHAHTDNRKNFELMKIAWETQEQPLERTDTRQLWTNIADKAGIIPSEKQSTGTTGRIIHAPSSRYIRNYGWLKYAAMVIFAILIPYLASVGIKNYNPSNGLQTVTIAKGKTANLTLDDGTTIMLDSGSQLKYPDKFDGKTREVYLEGEGYFEVAKNPDKPFIIHAGDARIQVLGTKFNVRAWDQDKEVAVAVSEGKVSLQQDDEESSTDPVVIEKGQSSLLKNNGTVTKPSPTNINQHLAWTKNEIYFQDTELQDVFSRLERWYDVSFVVDDTSIVKERVNMHVQKTSIDDVLELLSMLTELQVERSGKSIRLAKEIETNIESQY